MTNAEMRANRFYIWARARRTVRLIQQHLAAGRKVVICTYTKAVKYDKRHISMFKAAKNGAFVQRGKNWDCIDGCTIRIWG